MPARKPGTKKTTTPVITSSKVKANKVKAKPVVSEVVAEKVGVVSTSDENNDLDTYYGFKVLSRTFIPLGEIKREYNVRSFANETAVDAELLESIKAVGVKSPLVLNENLVLLDGHRRFFHAKQVFKLDEKVKVIIIDIEPNEVAYFQYLTGLEKGHTKDERDTAILKFAQDNPELSDREIAKRFGLGSNATVSNLTKIIREAPSLTKYVLDRQISKACAVDLVVEAKKAKKEPEKIAKALVEQLVATNKLDTDDNPDNPKPVTRTVTNKILGTLLPKFTTSKSQTVPTAKKLLKDLFVHLKPHGNLTKEGKQEYNAVISPDLIKQIELLLNGSIADRYKHKFHKEFKLERKTEYIEYSDLYSLWGFYCGLTLPSSITVSLATEDTYFFADENSEFFEDILNNNDYSPNREFHDGADWCQISKEVLTEENLVTIAKKHDLHLLIIDLVKVETEDEDDVSEIESKKEVEIIKEPKKPVVEVAVTEVETITDTSDDDEDYSSLLDDFTEVEVDEDTVLADELDELEDNEELTEDEI